MIASTDTLSTPLPRGCSYSSSDWLALAPHWYPVALSSEVVQQPVGIILLDERVVLYRLSDGKVHAARNLCLHRGAPLSSGSVQGDRLVCAYHGFQFDGCGRCVGIPAHPGVVIPSKLNLQTYQVQEKYGLVWVRLIDDIPRSLADFDEWSDPDYLQVLPDAFVWNASAGRQLESFIDVSHFSFVHRETFGEFNNTVVPEYKVSPTGRGFDFNYISTSSNFPVHLRHLNPEGFLWERSFRVCLPFSARLSIRFPCGGLLHILNAACPVSARKTRVFVPICRNFDKSVPLQETLDFNHRVFEEDRSIVEQQYPEDLPVELNEEVHIRADLASITYRKMLGEAGLGRSFTA